MDANASNQDRSSRTLKLLVSLILLPMIIGLFKSLVFRVLSLPLLFQKSLYWGLGSYLIFHIFLTESLKSYRRTQGFVQDLFGFFSRFFEILCYIVPFWIIIVAGGHWVVCKMFGLAKLEFLFFFLSGFFFLMHLILTAKILKSDKRYKLIDYISLLFIIVAVNIFFFAFNVKLYHPAFSVIGLARDGLSIGLDLSRKVIEQLFLFR